MDAKREMLMHTLATLAYRTAKAVERAPARYPDFDAGEGTRTPIQILRHMADLLRQTRSLFVPGEPIQDPPEGHAWADAVDDLRDAIRTLARELPESQVRVRMDGVEVTAEQILQGPLSDAITHAGQLAYLRRLAGSPIPSENFMRADVHRVLREWTAPRPGHAAAAPEREPEPSAAQTAEAPRHVEVVS
ncbi:MAG TPA: hypothetical protein VFH27_13880 [Longimicrobiaceae bacterium]|nr:hypothetical protein [Longimicrobiaceae bacterium]